MIIELRHDNAADWVAANPLLVQGELGIEDDTGLFKIGDGVTRWNDLGYSASGTGGGLTQATADALYATQAQGAKADSALQPGSLAAVATSGAYADLSGKPAIPTNNNQLTNGAGYKTTDTTYSVATGSADGLMSSADKLKLDGLGGGGSYTLPTASGTTLGGVKIGANVTIAGGVISVAAPITSNAGLTNDAGYLTQHQSLAGYALTSQLFSGSYTDLTNKPSIPAAQVSADWNASTGVAQILNKPALFSGAYTDLTGKPALATVATSGSYTDLSSKPTIPAAQVNSDWSASSGVAAILNKPTLGTAAATNASAYATAAQGAKADTAVQPGSLATVATSGAYSDLSGKPTPVVILTQSAYDALGTKDANTVYVIKP